MVGFDVHVNVVVRVCDAARGGRILGSILDMSILPGLSSGVLPHALASDLGALW